MGRDRAPCFHINLMNAPYYLVDAIMGIIILFAIIFENVKNRKL